LSAILFFVETLAFVSFIGSGFSSKVAEASLGARSFSTSATLSNSFSRLLAVPPFVGTGIGLIFSSLNLASLIGEKSTRGPSLI
jgi:hypothetical protein